MADRLVAHDNLPGWVRKLADGTPELEDRINHAWVLNDQGVYTSYRRTGTYAPIKPTLPPNVDPKDVVDWYSLPTWLKGSYSTEAQMRRMQSFTWVRGSATTYFAYESNGKYAGMWETE